MYDYRKAKERYDAGLSTKQELQAARSYAGHKALSDAGTAANIFGQIIQGQAQAHGMNVDARTLEEQALEARAKTLYQEGELAREGARLMASQRLLFDTAGVTMEGSPSLFLMDTQRELDMDTLILRREGHKEYLQLRGQAQAMRRAASDTKFATFTSVVGEVAKGLAMS